MHSQEDVSKPDASGLTVVVPETLLQGVAEKLVQNQQFSLYFTSNV